MTASKSSVKHYFTMQSNNDRCSLNAVFSTSQNSYLSQKLHNKVIISKTTFFVAYNTKPLMMKRRGVK
jgi:hypothetical protein